MCFTCTLQWLSNYLLVSHGEHTSSSLITIAWKNSVKIDPWVMFNKITSSSMPLSEGNRHSCRVCLANESYFHIKSLSGEIIFCHLHFPHRAYLILSVFVFPKYIKRVLLSEQKRNQFST